MVYMNERNKRTFQNTVAPTGKIVAAINKVVQTTVISRPRAPRTKENWQLILEWSLPQFCSQD